MTLSSGVIILTSGDIWEGRYKVPKCCKCKKEIDGEGTKVVFTYGTKYWCLDHHDKYVDSTKAMNNNPKIEQITTGWKRAKHV